MRIVYLHQYFKTPEDGEAMRSYYIATAMVKAGHQVVMITAHNKSAYQKKVIEGIEVHYLPISYSNEFGFSRRLKAFIIFQKRSVKLVKSLGKFDLCYATSTPLTVGSAALKLKKDIGLPYIFEVRDLWPDAPIELGVINNKIIIKSLRKLERQIYDNAKKIVVLNPGVKTIVEERTTTSVCLIPNISDIDFYTYHKAENTHPVILYAGTIGPANDLDQAITLSEHYPEANFVIAGDGKEVAKLKSKVENSKLNNIVFLGKVDKEELRRLYQKADFALVTFKQEPILELNSPNKFFDALANGVPPIITVKGWLKNLVEEYGCGWYIDPQNPSHTIKEIHKTFNSPHEMETRGKRARKLAEDKFAVRKLTSELVNLMV